MANELPTSREEFLGLLSQPTPDEVSSTPKTDSAVKITEQSFNRLTGALGQVRLPVPQADVEAAKMGARPNVELDIESGIPESVQIAAELNRRQQDQLAYYRKTYGDKNVDLSPEGGIVLRNIEDTKTGKVRDILVHPKGLGLDDAITLSTAAPEILAGFFAARSGNGKGAWDAVKSIARMAGASEAAGALKDVGVRKFQGTPVDLPEVAKARAEMAAIDVMAGFGTGVTTKALGTIVSPFSNKGPIQEQMQEGIDLLKNRWGESLSPTPGQATGSGLLLRMEARARQMPGSALPFEKLEAQNDASISRLLKKFLGIAPDATDVEARAAIPTSEATGERAMGAIGQKAISEFEAPVQKARAQALQAGTSEVESLTGTIRGTPVGTSDIGAAKRAKAVSAFKDFKDEADANYQALFSDPLVQTKNVSGNGIAAEAQSLIKKFPTKTVTKEEATGLVDEFGKPITRTVTGEEVIHEFVPPGVEKRLSEMASWKGQNFRLDELKQIRTEIDNAIAEGLSIPGTKVGYLKKMRSIVNDGIEKGIDDIGDKNLKALWQKTNDHYTQGMARFEPPAIRRLLVKPGETTLGNAKIAEDAFSDIDTFNAYKQFFGARSSEMESLRAGIRQKAFNNAFDTGGEYVRAKDFLANLKSMPDEIRMDVFPNEKAVTQALQASGIAEGAIAVEDLANLASNKSTTYQSVLDFLSAQNKQNQAYRNNILRSIAKGNVDPDTIKPSEFVAKFVRSSDPKDIRQVLGMITDQPDLVQQIRQRAAMDFLEASAESASDVASLPLPAAQKLSRIFKFDTNSEKYRAVLGNDVYEGLDAVRKFMAAGGQKFGSFSGAGGLAASTQIGNIFEKGEISAIVRAVNNFAISTLYTVPVLRKYLANNALTPESAARAVNAAIASTPFIEAVTKHWKNEKDQSYVMEQLGRTVESAWQNANGPSGQATKKESLPQNRDEFLKLIGGQSQPAR